jgi:flagellar hook-associated protein 1 FlgK
MNDLLTALNDPAGMGAYGSFTLDSEGALFFTSNASRPVIMNVRNDSTARGAGGPKMSDLFGFGSELRATRSERYSVRADIVQNPDKLAFAQLDFAAAVGARVLAKGDNDGAFALATAGESAMRFERAGDLGVLTMGVSRYAAELGGVIGRTASNATERKDNADMVAKEADARRASIEGVNMDEELIQLTTYQQSYNAAARLIQAASEMYDTLVQMI